jgi:hypothetical protein
MSPQPRLPMKLHACAIVSVMFSASIKRCTAKENGSSARPAHKPQPARGRRVRISICQRAATKWESIRKAVASHLL